jgi:hypothetical protein
MKHTFFSILALGFLSVAGYGQASTAAAKPESPTAAHVDAGAAAGPAVATAAPAGKKEGEKKASSTGWHIRFGHGAAAPGTSLVTGQGGFSGPSTTGTGWNMAGTGLKFAHSQVNPGTGFSTGQGGFTGGIRFGGGDVAPGTVLTTGQGGFSVSTPGSSAPAKSK